MSSPFVVRFVASAAGDWRIDRVEPVRGERLPAAAKLAVLEGVGATVPAEAAWALRGVTSNERYVNRAEHDMLAVKQPSLGRPSATRAALIPIRKSDAWWELAQDERRAILGERSRHIDIGREYLPAVARRLYHSHDLGEPFDFLTWFEYAPEDARAFEDLVTRLRQTEEWSYVEREVDIRLSR